MAKIQDIMNVLIMNIGWIRARIRSNEYHLTVHAEEERQDEKISLADLERALLGGKILEQYADDSRGPCCLVLGHSESSYPMHLVVGATTAKQLRIITVYIPRSPKWVNPGTRNKR